MFQDLLGPSNSVSKSVLAKPKEPVSAMRGKSSALASPMFAVAAASVCSASRTSGRRSSSSDGQAGGHRGRQLLLARRRGRAGSGPGCGRAARESSFSFCGDQPLEVVDDGLDAVQLGLRLAAVELGRDAALEAVLGELTYSRRDSSVRRAISSRRSSVAQLEVGPGHVGDQREHGRAPRLLVPRKSAFCASVARRMRPKKSISQDTSARDGVDRGLGRSLGAVVAVGRVDEAAAVEAQARRPSRSRRPSGQRSALREAVARARLLDALDRDLEVLVLDERDLDQLLELRVLEQLPPGRVGEALGLGRGDLAPGRRRGHLGPLVVRARACSRPASEREAAASEPSARHRQCAPPCGRRAACGGGAARRRALLLAPELLDEGEVAGDQEHAERGRDEHAPEHGGAHHVLRAGAGAAGPHQRHDAEDEGEGRHQDRPEAQARRLERRLLRRPCPRRAWPSRTRRSGSRSWRRGRSA